MKKEKNMEKEWEFPESGVASLIVIVGMLCISVITLAYCLDIEDEESRIPEQTEFLDRSEWTTYMNQKGHVPD